MLGIAKGAGGYRNPPSPPNVSVSISPVRFLTVSSNGSYTTPFFTATVNNGVGPFTYSWSIDNGTVLTPTSNKTRVQVSGYNSEVIDVLRLTVTDTGDSNKTATATAPIEIIFGLEDRR